jgi:hypothetical protein
VLKDTAYGNGFPDFRPCADTCIFYPLACLVPDEDVDVLYEPEGRTSPALDMHVGINYDGWSKYADLMYAPTHQIGFDRMQYGALGIVLFNFLLSWGLF